MACVCFTVQQLSQIHTLSLQDGIFGAMFAMSMLRWAEHMFVDVNSMLAMAVCVQEGGGRESA